MNILLVDDEELMTRALSRHLRHDKFTVYTAQDIAQAKLALASCFIDLVITDMDLGEGLQQGRDLLKWIEEHSPMTRRVLMSGSAYTPESAPEAHHILQKPFPITDLKSVLSTHG